MTTNEQYSPGLHRLVTLQVDDTERLTNSAAFMQFSEWLIDRYALEKVGQIVHNFTNNSYTVSICLKESHICIHTWPEFI